MRWLQLGIRSLVAIVLLAIVWRNSHWSVSLLLTLIMAAIEFSNQNRLDIIKILKRMMDEGGT